MINYVSEMAEELGISINDTKNYITFSSIGGKILVINNYLKIITYSTSKVVLKAKDNVLNIEGENIVIKELNKNSICLVGNIINLYFSKEV